MTEVGGDVEGKEDGGEGGHEIDTQRTTVVIALVLVTVTVTVRTRTRRVMAMAIATTAGRG